jgi:hypothetical protein
MARPGVASKSPSIKRKTTREQARCLAARVALGALAALTACDALVGVGDIDVVEGGGAGDASRPPTDARADGRRPADAGSMRDTAGGDHTVAMMRDAGPGDSSAHDAGLLQEGGSGTDGCTTAAACGPTCEVCAGSINGTACIDGKKCGCNGSADCPATEGGVVFQCAVTMNQCCVSTESTCNDAGVCVFVCTQ